MIFADTGVTLKNTVGCYTAVYIINLILLVINQIFMLTSMMGMNGLFILGKKRFRTNTRLFKKKL
jgi:hypothetical protein